MYLFVGADAHIGPSRRTPHSFTRVGADTSVRPLD